MLQPPSESINIDCAFERACASTQVEPNYSEKGPEGECWKPLAKWLGKIKVNEHKRSNDIPLVGSLRRPQSKVAVMWGGDRCLPWITTRTCGKGWVGALDTRGEIFVSALVGVIPPVSLLSLHWTVHLHGASLWICLWVCYLWPFECRQFVSWSLSKKSKRDGFV